MPRLFLFLWFAVAILALGEARDEQLLSGGRDAESLPVVDTATFKHDSEQDAQVASNTSNKIGIAATEKPLIKVSLNHKPIEPVPPPVKPEETLVGQNSTWTRVLHRPALSSQNATAATIETPLRESSDAAAVDEDESFASIRQTDVRSPLSSGNFIGSHGPGKWVVNVTNHVCIMVQMAMTVHISYTDVDNKTSSRTFEIPADNTTRASGFCGKAEQNLTLEWRAQNLTTAAVANMTMHFVKNETEKNYSLRRLDVFLPAAAINFPNSTLNETIVLVYDASPSDYVIGLTESYRCLKRQTLWLKRVGRGVNDPVAVNDRNNQTSGYLTVSDLQFQAFKPDNSTVFGLARDCAFDTPDVVPIAVGCALAALVVIVLVAYLIGRRRSQVHGYLSM